MLVAVVQWLPRLVPPGVYVLDLICFQSPELIAKDLGAPRSCSVRQDFEGLDFVELRRLGRPTPRITEKRTIHLEHPGGVSHEELQGVQGSWYVTHTHTHTKQASKQKQRTEFFGLHHLACE